MQQETLGYEAIVDTLRWAAQGYVIGHGEVVRPMPWRRILDHLAVLGGDELLCIDPSPNGTGSGITVRRIAANGRSGARPSAANGSRQMTRTVDAREGSRTKSRFAQRIEMAVRSGRYRSVTCMRRGSRILAVMTAASVRAARSNGDCQPPRVRAVASAKGLYRGLYRMTRYQRRTRRKRYAAYMIAAASLLLSVAALLSAATGNNDEPAPLLPANAIVGHVLIEGRGAEGVTVALDGRAATVTTGVGAFRFDGVKAGFHTITISNYPADARFDRTSATASIDAGGRAATVSFSGSYIRRSRIARRPAAMAEGGATGRHSTLPALRKAAGHGIPSITCTTSFVAGSMMWPLSPAEFA